MWPAWTDPAPIGQRLGPKGCGSKIGDVDVRVGGRFLLEMCAPDGTVYPCKGVYTQIVRPECIVYSSAADDGHPCGAGLPPRSEVTISFVEHGHKTTLTIHTLFESVARKTAAVSERFSISWQESLERLAAFLETK